MISAAHTLSHIFASRTSHAALTKMEMHMNRRNMLLTGFIATLFTTGQSPYSLAATAPISETDVFPQYQNRSKFYIYGNLDGTLGGALKKKLAPKAWFGQTDRSLIMPGKAVKRLNRAMKAKLRKLHDAGQVIVLTQVTQDSIDALSQALEESTPITLKPPYPYLDYYAYASHPSFGKKGFNMMPPEDIDGKPAISTESSKEKGDRIEQLLDWLKAFSQPKTASPATVASAQSDCGSGCVDITSLSASYYWTSSYPVKYSTATCDFKSSSGCTNTYQVQTNIWTVHSNEAANNISDYFVVELSANLAPQGCYGWYRGKGYDEDDRIAAYWARQYQFKAYSQKYESYYSNWPYEDFQVNTDYQPNTQNQSVDVSTGTSWNIGGTGTVGSSGASTQFTAGVKFDNSSKQTYTAMAVTSNVASSAQSNPSLAQWDYDSYQYVYNSIKPNTGACPSAYNFAAIDGTEVAATFSPKTTFIWQATNNVRDWQTNNDWTGNAAHPTLPVHVDVGVLLGWAYYPDSIYQCETDQNRTNEPTYDLDGSPSGNGTLLYTSSGAAMPGILYDVGCGTNDEWGTLPLGPYNKKDKKANGNPGGLWMLYSPELNVEFAPLEASN